MRTATVESSCASLAGLAGLVLSFIACFILLVIAPLGVLVTSFRYGTYWRSTVCHTCKMRYREGYRTFRPQDTSASRHSWTLRHRSQDTSTPKTWHERRDREKAGTLRVRLRTILMRHSSTGDQFVLNFSTNFVVPNCLVAEVSGSHRKDFIFIRFYLSIFLPVTSAGRRISVRIVV